MQNQFTFNIIFYNQENKSKQLRCLRRPTFCPATESRQRTPGSPILAISIRTSARGSGQLADSMAAEKERAKVLIASKRGGSHLQSLSIGAHFHSPLTNDIAFKSSQFFSHLLNRKLIKFTKSINFFLKLLFSSFNPDYS